MRKILTTIAAAMMAAAAVANTVDSIYIFTYANAPKGGLHTAYSYDAKHWNAIANERAFVTCDYGTWGAEKRMFSPSVLPVGSDIYAVWEVNQWADQFATTRTTDLYVWKPQDYPYMHNGTNVLEPTLTHENGQFVVSYKSKDNAFWQTRSSDFKQWTAPVSITETEYTKRVRRTTVSINGNKQTGEINRVPAATLNNLLAKAALAVEQDNAANINLRNDAETFKNVKSQAATLSIHLDQTKDISPELIGIFFEDINYAADGGLYAELIQNRDFEYNNLDRGEWNAQSFWQLTGNGTTWDIATDNPIHANNSHYAVLTTTQPGAALTNDGFDGIALRKGEAYDLSLFLRTLDGQAHKIRVSLKDGSKTLASTTFTTNANWKQLTATLKPSANCDKATLAIEPQDAGKLAIDFVSLFPRNTFKNRKNGLRADLAQTLADLHPQFIRFPGGCASHGNGIENIYHWDETVGPLWERKTQSNLWGYHQSKGLGFYEYFQFCEDIGAQPLPVLAAGVPCQNSSRGGAGQQGGIPWDQMDDYVDELCNLIEWANGDPATSKWAKMRAEAGHPKPFHLKYLGVGNEDLISDVFTERFTYIFNAIQKRHPEITVVGTVGPFFQGSDYEYGWQLAHQLNVPIVDEHYYVSPGWYIANQQFYDRYDRSKTTRVYLGEWASRGNRLENALAEAMHITNLERNADMVVMSSYAPLLAKEGHTQWNPDLIYFNNTEVKPTVNYYVQHLAGNNNGIKYVDADLNVTATRTEGRDNKEVNGYLASVSQRISQSVVIADNGDLIIKLVNITPNATPLQIQLPDAAPYKRQATLSVIKGDITQGGQKTQTSTYTLSGDNTYEMPPYSFSVLRFPASKKTKK